MTRILTAAFLGLSLVAGLPLSSAMAQSYNAPAGISAATAPGGTPDRGSDWIGRAPNAAYDSLTTGTVRNAVPRGEIRRR